MENKTKLQINTSSAEADDPYKCKAASSTGRWLHHPNATFAPSEKFQPNGCMLRDYTSDDVAQCLSPESPQNVNGEHNAAFIGDSHVRKIFWSVAAKLGTLSPKEAKLRKLQVHGDLTFTSGTRRLDFFWDNYMDRNDTPAFVRPTQVGLLHSNVSLADLNNTKTDTNRALVLVGTGAWFAASQTGAAEPIVSAFANRTAGMFEIPIDNQARGGISPKIFFNGALPPYYPRRSDYVPSIVNALNSYSMDRASRQGFTPLRNFLFMANKTGVPRGWEPDGRHYSLPLQDLQAEILLNIRCNNGIQTFPYVGTCCFKYEPFWYQYAIFGLGVVALLAFINLQLPGRSLLKSALDVD